MFSGHAKQEEPEDCANNFGVARHPPSAPSIAIDPQQRFLYTVSNFQPGISVFAIDAASGHLTPVAGSPFAATAVQRIAKVHPKGKFLYVSDQGGGTVSAFAINQMTGAISPIAGSPFAGRTQVSGLDIEPFGRFLYTANHDGDSN